MLRYYVYVYLCGAAITAYVGFLELRFEEMNRGAFPAFEAADVDDEQKTESAKNRVRRHILEKMALNDDPLIKKVEEFHRAFQAMKLRKLQHRSLSEPKFKVTEQRRSGSFPAPLSKTAVEEGTMGKRMRKRRQTEVKMSAEKEKRKLRRVKRDKAADEMLQRAHASKDQQDIYRGDPNEFFDEEKQETEDNQVQEGVAKQLFVVHWMRTLGYFLLLQVLIFGILFFAFWSYGYYRYEVWKSKVDGLYGTIVEMFRSFNQAEVGMTPQFEKANIEVEETMEKLQEEEEQREELLSRKMQKREEREALQKVAYENVQRVEGERQRHKKAAEGKQKDLKQTVKKGKETHKSKDKHKSTRKADGKMRK